MLRVMLFVIDTVRIFLNRCDRAVHTKKVLFCPVDLAAHTADRKLFRIYRVALFIRFPQPHSVANIR